MQYHLKPKNYDGFVSYFALNAVSMHWPVLLGARASEYTMMAKSVSGILKD